MAVLEAVASGADTLAAIVDASDVNRATAHRLAAALEAHGLLRRDAEGHYALGLHLWSLGQLVPGPAVLAELAQPVLDALRDDTGESAQLYVVDGADRLCVAASESGHGLRTIVPVGARLPLDRGSGGAALLADGETSAGWFDSVAAREVGVASVSAPVTTPEGRVIAAVSISGPIDRLGDAPGARHGVRVHQAASELEALGSSLVAASAAAG